MVTSSTGIVLSSSKDFQLAMHITGTVCMARLNLINRHHATTTPSSYVGLHVLALGLLGDVSAHLYGCSGSAGNRASMFKRHR